MNGRDRIAAAASVAGW